jgi:hypothetical protein
MISKGGKIKYSCPNCESDNIRQAKIHGQNSVLCNACMHFFPWGMRIKRSQDLNRTN